MKKIFSTAILLLITICTIYSAPKAPVLTPVEIDAVSDESETNTYIVDPRIEVVGMICRLAEMEGFTYNYNGDNAFLTQMNTLFEKYKGHKAVTTVKALVSKGIDSSAMISLAYHIKPDFSGTIIDFSPVPDTLYFAWKKIGTKAIYDLVKQIHDFAADSNFGRIYTLNKGTYIGDIGYMKKDLEKAGFAQWSQDFFKNDEIQKPAFVISRICVGCNYYDFAIGSDGKRLSYVTTFPGTYYNTLENCYMSLYTQLYASKYWDTIKEGYLNYERAYIKKFQPDMKDKDIEKTVSEITDYNIAILMASYSWIEYLREKTPEDHPAAEEVIGAMEKALADDNILKALDLVEEYSTSRETYPTFDDFAPRLNDFISNIKLSE